MYIFLFMKLFNIPKQTMRNLLSIIVVIMLLGSCSKSDEDVDNSNSSGLAMIELEYLLDGDYELVLNIDGEFSSIDWGDGVIQDFSSFDITKNKNLYKHYYSFDDTIKKSKIKIIGNGVEKLEIYDSEHRNFYSVDVYISVRVSNSPKLKSLSLIGLRYLNMVDLSGAPFLDHLSIIRCTSFEQADVATKCPNLEYLKIYNCKLKSIDLSKNPKIMEINCSDNDLTSLNVDNNADLISLSCRKNYISELNLKNQKQLRDLDCCYNEIEVLDLSSTDSLESLSCSDIPLRGLKLSDNNPLLRAVGISDCNLEYYTINQLFRVLPIARYYKLVTIYGNPGANICDKSIAINKGWTIQ